MSVEALKSVFDIGTVILLFLTFAFGAGALVTGNIINKRQAGQLQQFAVDISHANQRAAEANQIAEGEKLARIKLEKQIAPRTVVESDRAKLGEELRKFAAGFKGRKIKISSQTGDAEGMVFSLEIMDILTRAGLDVDPVGMGRLIPVGGVYMGANVTGPVGDETFIRSLVKGLATHADTAVHGEWAPKYPEVEIMVGVKSIAGLEKDWVHQAPK